MTTIVTTPEPEPEENSSTSELATIAATAAADAATAAADVSSHEAETEATETIAGQRDREAMMREAFDALKSENASLRNRQAEDANRIDRLTERFDARAAEDANRTTMVDVAEPAIEAAREDVNDAMQARQELPGGPRRNPIAKLLLGDRRKRKRREG